MLIHFLRLRAQILFILLSIAFIFGWSDSFAQIDKHPRIYCSADEKIRFTESVKEAQWKQQWIEEKKENLDKYLRLCHDDPNWLVSRLQMNWKTKHSKVFLKGGKFSHSEGSAPCPTVRFTGSRDKATLFEMPELEDVEPYFDDPRGMFLKNKETGNMEWVHPSETGFIIHLINNKILQLVEDAAFLFWYTGDEKYAEFARPVFFTYIEGMYYREAPYDLENSKQQRLSGLATFEVIHDHIVIPLSVSYDFLYSYFQAKQLNTKHVDAVLQKWGDQIINNGVAENNWNLFQARFLTYIALVLNKDEEYKNRKGQNYFLRHIFDETTERQIALKESVLQYDQKTGIWPESASYSLHVTSTILRILTLLDNVTNQNELQRFPLMENVVLASFEYLFPNGRTVAFGDASHQKLPPENFELLVSNYLKYGQKEKAVDIAFFLNQMIDEGTYKREVNDLFKLFFYRDHLPQNTLVNAEELNSKLISPTFYAPNVSLFIQRMGSADAATMVSTVGSFGNHAHVNGIAIELYANNWVMAPDMGIGSSYWHPEHRYYYSQFPAHNTVVVDGISEYQGIPAFHPFTLDNCFPKPETRPAFEKVTYSKVSFVEPKTLSDQQRLTAQIKSTNGKVYIVDVFRSRKQEQGTQKHEYIYHNIGQSLNLYEANGKALDLMPSEELGSQHGDLKGYDYFTDKQVTSTSENVKAVFNLDLKSSPDQFMNVWIKGSKNQKLFSVKAPKSKASNNGSAPLEVLGKEIPTLILQRKQEAWTDPFVVIFNPEIENTPNPIQNVNFSTTNKNAASQKISVSLADQNTKDLIVVNSSLNDVCADEDFYMKGLLSIIRKAEAHLVPDFIFASGVYQLKFNDWEIVAKNEAVTVSIEMQEGVYHIENDKAIVLKVPIKEGFRPEYIEVYEAGKPMLKRKGFISRLNPNQVEFLLEKAFSDARLVYYK